MNKLIKNANDSKARLNPIIMSILFLIYMMITVFMGTAAMSYIASSVFKTSSEILIQFFSFLSMIIFPYLWVRFIERRPKLNIAWKEIRRTYLLGALGGIIAVSLPSILMIILGHTGSLNFNFALSNILSVLVYMCFFMVQGAAEEVLVRWGLMIPLGRKLGLFGSIFITSLLFMALHLGNPGISALPLINLFLSGIVFGIMFYYHESPWPAFAAHSFWNFTMGNIFGILVSGGDFGPSIMRPNISGHAFIAGGGFGVEATIFTTIIGSGIFIVYLMLYKKKFGTFSFKESKQKEMALK